MGAELRRRRRALAEYEQPTRDAWEADLVAYDLLLCEAAAMLDVPTVGAPGAGEPLTAEQRAGLEEALAGAGLQVQP
ncbi:MAG TPA: hypothetical protein VNT56_03010 [Acidimicrobiales bacterium]|nr:hypothetical protein [Acidimicrobiales bacterium]